MHFDSPIRPSCYPLTPHLLVTDGIDTLYRASANNAAVSASHRHWPGGSWSLWGCGGSRRRPCPAAPSPGIPLPSAAPIPPVKRTTRVCQAHGPGSAQHPPPQSGRACRGARAHARCTVVTHRPHPTGGRPHDRGCKDRPRGCGRGCTAPVPAPPLCSLLPTAVNRLPLFSARAGPGDKAPMGRLGRGGRVGAGGGGTEKDSQPAPQTPTPHPPEQSAVHPLPPPPPHPPHPPPPACLFTGSARSCLRAAARAHCLSLGAIVPSGSPPAVHGTT